MRHAAPPLALLLLVGCGGRGGHVSSSAVGSSAVGKGKGTATLRVRWPARGRLIPNAANSIVVKVTLGTTVVSKTLARPADGTTNTSATLTGLAYGSYTVAVNAYPTTTGTGTAQAAGAGTMPVTEDTPGSLAVAMDSTAASLALVPQAASIALNQTIPVAASATDASGAIVLLAVGSAQENLSWTATPAASATITGTGPVVTVKGLAAGAITLGASLKVKDDGTLLSASTLLNVSATADYRLAVGGYPRPGGDAGNTGRGGGSGATGAVGWTATVGAAPVNAVVVGVDGTVYACSGGTVSAVSSDGAVLWQKPVDGTLHGLLLTRGGEILASGTKLTSLNVADGSPNWVFPDDFGVTFGSGEHCFLPNVLSDGTIIQATLQYDGSIIQQGKVCALDPYVKAVRWSTSFPCSASPVVAADDTVVIQNRVGTPSGYGSYLRGLVGATGAQAFSVSSTSNTGGSVGYPPTVTSNGFLAAASVTGNVIAFEEAVYTGTLLFQRVGSSYRYGTRGTWTSSLNRIASTGGAVTSTTLGTTAVYVPLSPVYGGPTPPDSPSGIADGAGGRFVLANSTKAFGLGWSTAWSVPVAGGGGASVDAAGIAYVASTDTAGVVKAIDPTSGTVRWTATLPAKGTGLPPAIGPGGTLYAGTADGRVVQIR